MNDQPAGPAPHPHSHALADLEQRCRQAVAALETVTDRAAANTGRLLPAWRRVTEGEHRLPVTVTVIAMIGLQSVVPERLSLRHWWTLPLIEVVMLAALIASNPRRIVRANRWLRGLSLALIATASLANGWSASNLVLGLVQGTEGEDAGPLLAVGGNVWLTNVIIFGLWYWDLDRGGPVARAQAVRITPDFLFPQMATPGIAAPDWEPQFIDYLYLAYTNATAFSPTDTLPLSRWSKLAMMLQSAISLATAALVIARAVNILK